MKNHLKMLITFLMLCFSYYAQSNQATERLLKLPEAARQSLLSKVLSASGEKCSSVNKTFFQGNDSDGKAYWNVACKDGNSYSITIHNDARGSTKVLNCKVLEYVRVSCFTKF